MKLILGLGNYGRAYDHTRHNAGWDAVTMLAKTLDTDGFREKEEFRADIAEAYLREEKILLVRPQTYMNHSGTAALAIKQFFKIPLEHILIVHDEMDYAVGKFAFTKSGGPAGHNGVASIQERLGTQDIARLRIGIGRPVPPLAKEDFVLQPFSPEEAAVLKDVFPSAEKAIQDWAAEGIDAAMNSWNGVLKKT